MRLNKKILSLISSYALIANLTSKPIDSISISDVREGILKRFGTSFAGGAVATPFINAAPVITMSVSDSIKEGSKSIREFLKILKRNSNASLRVFKWFAAMLTVPSAAGLIYYYPENPKPSIWCSLNLCLTACSLGISSGACLASWIGQKLTESKEDNFKNENKKEANQK